MTLIEGHRPLTPDVGIPVLDIDPYAEATLRDPTPYYTALRDAGPLVYVPHYNVLAVGRYEEARQTFSDHETFVSSRGIGLNDFKLEKPWRPPSIILEVDPPDHTKTRKVMSKALSPKVVRTYCALESSCACVCVVDCEGRDERVDHNRQPEYIHT